jgi:hypothetical protein
MRGGAARWLAAAWLGLAACGTPSTQPADLFVPPGAADSQVRERRFEGVPAQQASQAAVQVLQDASFLITASEPALGLIIGTRGGTLKSIGEVGPEVRSVLADAFTFGLAGEEPQAVRYLPKGFSVAVSVNPAASGSAVRVAFYRIITDADTAVVWIRELPAPEPHQKFFALLAQELSRQAR